MALSVGSSSNVNITSSLAPPGGIVVGELMLVCGFVYGATGVADCDLLTGGFGVPKISVMEHTADHTGGRDVRLKVWSKIADGTEAAISVQIDGIAGAFAAGRVTWLTIDGAKPGTAATGWVSDTDWIDGTTTIADPYVPALDPGIIRPCFDVAFTANEGHTIDNLNPGDGWTDSGLILHDTLGNLRLWTRNRTGAFVSPEFTFPVDPQMMLYGIMTVPDATHSQSHII